MKSLSPKKKGATQVRTHPFGLHVVLETWVSQPWHPSIYTREQYYLTDTHDSWACAWILEAEQANKKDF